MNWARRAFTTTVGLLFLLECAVAVFNLATGHGRLPSVSDPLTWFSAAIPLGLLIWGIVALRGSAVAAAAAVMGAVLVLGFVALLS